MAEEAVIRLLDSSGQKVLDSVSAEYEDSFSLETFGDLIDTHQSTSPKGTKNFILARVQTWDHKQPDKAFYSYYSAYQLNKILFQTQVYLGKKLIHRLHVLNPLTNTDIIGNVQYFMVKPRGSGEKEDGDKTIVNAADKMRHGIEKTSSLTEADISLPKVTFSNAVGDDAANATSGGKPVNGGERPSQEDLDDPLSPRSRSKRNHGLKLNINTASSGPGRTRMQDMLPPPSPTVKKSEANEDQQWTLSTPLVSEFREGSDMELRKLSKTSQQAVTPDSATGQYSPLIQGQPGSIAPPSATGDAARRVSQLQIATNLSRPPKGPLHTSDRHHLRSRTAVPAGQLTRFGSPVSAIEADKLVPPTKVGRRRSLSYMNTINSPNVNKKVDFEDWMKALSQEQKDKKTFEPNTDFHDGSGIADKLAHVTSPALQDSSATAHNNNNTHNSTTGLLSEAKKQDAEGHKIYDAVLFATDNDFLESSSIRAVFRTNAVSQEEVQLFEMPAFTGEQNNEQQVVVIIDDNGCNSLCCPTPQQLESKGACLRMLHRSKCYIIMFLVMVGLFVFIFTTVGKPYEQSKGKK